MYLPARRGCDPVGFKLRLFPRFPLGVEIEVIEKAVVATGLLFEVVQ